MSNSFIHLHLHSEYSISDSLIRIEELIDHVSKNKSPAVAITDNNNIFSLIKFYKTAIRKGVKPIIGIEINLEDELDTKDFSKIVLLCKNLKGFQNLSSLITESYINLNEGEVFKVSRENLAQKSEGLIALSGGIHGDLARAIKLERNDLIEGSINYWRKKFSKKFLYRNHKNWKKF